MLRESDRVQLLVETAAQAIGGARAVLLPRGSSGVVVLAHPAGTQCESYDIECQLPDGSWAVANVPAANLTRA